MHKFILMFAILATLSMSSHVQAQRGGQRGEGGPRGGQRGGAEGGARGQRPASPMMTALDADKDGKLSAEEIANAATALKTLDKNKDGVLDSSELAPPRGAQGGRSSQMVERIMARDTDGDGKVSKEEAGEQMGRIFGRMDADGDGFVTKTEIENMFQQFQGGGGRRGGGGRGAGGGGGRGGAGGGGRGGAGPSTKENRPGFDE